MKTSLLKPGFEFIFALSLIAILGLPPMLLAQAQKDVEIKIENGDTTVNGRNIRQLSVAERKEALRDISHISGDAAVTGDVKTDQHHGMFQRNDTVSSKIKRDDLQRMNGNVMFRRDSTGNMVKVEYLRRRDGANNPASKYRNFDDRPDGMDMRDDKRRMPMMRGERRNSQNFNYTNTDNDGISTHVTFHVSEAMNEDLKRMPHIEGSKLEINDLNLVPEFSTGKTLLLFNLPSKAAAEVTFVDNEGKVIWTEKTAAASFGKAFMIGLNGVYYLQVKQGNGITVKRIMKEE